MTWEATPSEAVAETPQNSSASVDAALNTGIDSSSSTSSSATPTPGSELTSSISNQSDFLNAFYRTTFSTTLTLSNLGSEVLFLGLVSASSDFALTSDSCLGTVMAGKSCNLNYSFTPTTVGTFTTPIIIAYLYQGVFYTHEQDINLVVSPKLATVAPLWPMHGGNWLDYVATPNLTGDDFSADDTACAGAETGRRACSHGGERRVVTLADEVSCAQITGQDNLDIFNWKCVIVNGGARLISTGFKEQRGLRNFLHGDTGAGPGWSHNAVRVKKAGDLIFESALSIWYSNPVVNLPDNSNPGDTVALLTSQAANGQPGTIYVLNSSRVTRGYNISANNVAVVTLDNSVLSQHASGVNNCNPGTGEVDSASKCLISAGLKKFLWIEAELKASTSTNIQADFAKRGIGFVNVKHSTINGSIISDASEVNLNSYLGLGLRIMNTTIHSSRGINVNLQQGVDTWAHGLRTINAAGSGLVLNSESNGVFNRIQSIGNGSSGIQLASPSLNSVFTEVLVANNGDYGIFVDNNSNRNTFFGVTSVNNGTSSSFGAGGISIYSNVSDTTLVQVLSIGNLVTQLSIDQYTATTKVAQLAVGSALFNVPAISLTNVGSAYFTENLVLLYNLFSAGCTVTGGSNNGVQSGACEVASTSGGLPASTHTVTRTLLPYSDSFVGRVVTDSNHANVSQTYSTISDWINFDNLFSGWGPTSAANWPSSALSGNCLSGSTCAIWDFSLKKAPSSSSWLYNRSELVTSENTAFTEGAPCPAAVSGGHSMVDGQTAPQQFLTNALEIIGDGIGNDNGLCESGEACTYMANFGAYQGHGSLSSSICSYEANGSSLSNIQIYGWSDNGY